MKASTKRMIKKYGEELCFKAVFMNEITGNGTSGISWDLNVRFNTAEALISAGRDIAKSRNLNIRDLPDYVHNKNN